MNLEYQKLSNSTLKSGMMIRKKKELESDLKKISKEIADKTNEMRMQKHDN